MKTPPADSSKSTLREKGAALVITLLVVTLLATIVTGFIAATRIEQMASRNFTYQNVAEQMALLATEQAISQLNRDVGSAITASGTAITMPGATVVNGSIIPLSSASAPGASTATLTNLNRSGIIHSNTSANFAVPLISVSSTNAMTNTLFGRFAYWIDDDGSRANLNLLGSTNTRPNYIPTNSIWRDIFDTRALAGTNGSNLAASISRALTNTAATNPWPYYFTPRQIYSTNANPNNCPPGTVPPVSARALFPMVSAGPINLSNVWFVTNAPFKGSRINLNQSQSTNIVSNVRYGVNFIDNPSTNAPLTTTLNDLITTRIDRSSITNKFGGGFENKYGRDVLRQILVNINDLNLATGASGPPSATAVTGSANTNSDGIPTQYSGLRRFIHLNEIACKAAYTTNSPIPNNRVEFQIWFAVEVVNPYSDRDWGAWSELKFGTSSFSANVSYTLGGNLVTTTVGSGWGGQTPTIGRLINNEIASNSYFPSAVSSGNLSFAIEYQAGGAIPSNASNITVSQITFRPSYVKLFQWENSNATIRDWATTSDFLQHSGGNFTFNNPPLVNTALKSSWAANPNHLTPPPANIANFNLGSLGIAKNDPRVRTFPSWGFSPQAWSWVGGSSPNAVTIGTANTGTVNFNASTGRPNVPTDRTSASAPNIFTHESFSNAFRAELDNIPYLSVMELGKVHTGLQWRTLQLRSQHPTEAAASLIPDWALLDTFYISNSIPKINLNSVYYPAVESSSMAALATGGLLRPQPLESLLRGGTNASAATNAFFQSSSAMSASGANGPATISTNISRLTFNPTWANRRAAISATNNPRNSFPTNTFAAVGEVLEIENVANFNTADAVNEGRGASFIEAVSTFSDVFSIYATGYAVDRTGATVSEFSTRTQVQWDPAAGRFRTVFTEPIRSE